MCVCGAFLLGFISNVSKDVSAWRRLRSTAQLLIGGFLRPGLRDHEALRATEREIERGGRERWE